MSRDSVLLFDTAQILLDFSIESVCTIRLTKTALGYCFNLKLGSLNVLNCLPAAELVAVVLDLLYCYFCSLLLLVSQVGREIPKEHLLKLKNCSCGVELLAVYRRDLMECRVLGSTDSQ